MISSLLKYIRDIRIKKKYRLDKTVKLGYPIYISGNVSIGKNTYVNSYSYIVSGPNSWVKIGKNCAISYNVHIRAITHDPDFPTGDNKKIIEKSIIIGDNVWIGANVIIREGIIIGDDVTIGANSVVTHDIPPHVIVGGVPARIIRMKKRNDK